MTLPSSPPISLKELKTEFGGGTVIGLRQYLSGGSFVSANVQNGSGFLIPSSGTISLNDFLGAANNLPTRFYQSGSGTETVPTGALFCTIEAWGGGGGGGQGDAFSNPSCGGGGAGGYVLSVRLPVTAAQTFSYSVGSGGAAIAFSGADGTNGNPGANTSITHTGMTTIQAGGGLGGHSSPVAGNGNGGAGGGATGGTTLNQAGNTGSTGSGGTLGAGATANSGLLGTGGGYGTGGHASTIGSTYSGSGPGGAGAGAGNSSSSYEFSSGAGASGGARFIYYAS